MNAPHYLQDRRPQKSHSVLSQSRLEGNSHLWRPQGLLLLRAFHLLSNVDISGAAAVAAEQSCAFLTYGSYGRMAPAPQSDGLRSTKSPSVEAVTREKSVGWTQRERCVRSPSRPLPPCALLSIVPISWESVVAITYCLLGGKADAVCIQVFQEGSVNRIRKLTHFYDIILVVFQ